MNERNLFSNNLANAARLMCICTICTMPYWISMDATPVTAQEIYDPTKYFGDANDFIENFEAGVKDNINEYMGTAIAITGFILVVRTFT